MRKALPVLLTVAIAMLLSIPITYAALRGYDVCFRREGNPATVIWSAKIAMFWRLNVGLFIAGMVAFPAALAARRNLERTLRVLLVMAQVAAVMIALQGILLP